MHPQQAQRRRRDARTDRSSYILGHDREQVHRALAHDVGVEQGGYLTRSCEGRGNIYELHPEQPLRHPVQQGHQIGDLLRLLEREGEQEV